MPVAGLSQQRTNFAAERNDREGGANPRSRRPNAPIVATGAVERIDILPR